MSSRGGQGLGRILLTPARKKRPTRENDKGAEPKSRASLLPLSFGSFAESLRSLDRGRHTALATFRHELVELGFVLGVT
jgi:hypothetical protein